MLRHINSCWASRKNLSANFSFPDGSSWLITWRSVNKIVKTWIQVYNMCSALTWEAISFRPTFQKESVAYISPAKFVTSRNCFSAKLPRTATDCRSVLQNEQTKNFSLHNFCVFILVWLLISLVIWFFLISFKVLLFIACLFVLVINLIFW